MPQVDNFFTSDYRWVISRALVAPKPLCKTQPNKCKYYYKKPFSDFSLLHRNLLDSARSATFCTQTEAIRYSVDEGRLGIRAC